MRNNPTALDRILASFRSLVSLQTEAARYFGLYEYSVQATDGVTADCAPTDTTIGLPGSVKVALWPGILGEVAKPAVGSRCLLGFVNGDRSRPMVIGGDPGQIPQSATVDVSGPLAMGPSASSVNIAAGTFAAARQTDAILAGGFLSGTIVGPCSLKVVVG